MKFLLNKNSIFLLLLGVIWVFLHVFFLPFHVWDAGILRPWYILNGFIPYRDFGWIRMPFDLFLMAGWYKIFGVNPVAYQFFVYTILIILTISLFFISRLLIPRLPGVAFLFFMIFLFPLFQNTEEGEILIGILNLWLLAAVFLFLKRQNIRYLAVSGVISGVSLATKQNSGLVIMIVLLTIILGSFSGKKKVVVLSKYFFVYMISMLVPVMGLVLCFLWVHGLRDFLYYTVFFVLGPYRHAYVLHGDGLWIIGGYLCLLIPFIIFWKKTALQFQFVFFLVLQILALFASLLPSYLSYRAFTSFPLICIVAGLIVTKVRREVALISLLLFLFFTSRFIIPYITAIKDEGFKTGQYLTSYGPIEYQIADWIKKNSKEDERIMNYGSEMIYLLANRLPKNKYVDPFPYALKPYEQSTEVFLNDPPRIVVYDQSLPQDHPGLSEWPFLSFLEKNYQVINRFDKNLILYKYKGERK